jgi:putative ABC transport system permease protein
VLVRRVLVRRVRAELPLMLCLGVLTGLLSLVAAAGPAVVDGLAGRALAARTAQEQLAAPAVRFGALFEPKADGLPVTGDLAGDLKDTRTVIESAAPGPLAGRVTPESARVEIPAGTARAPGGTGTFTLLLADDGPGPGGYVEGRPPSDTSSALEIAVSTRTRDALKLRLGHRLDLIPAPGSKQASGTARVVGFFTPADSGLMREVPLLATPLNAPGKHSALTWQTAALIGAAAAGKLQEDENLTLLAVWRLRLNLDAATATPLTTGEGRTALRLAVAQYRDQASILYCGAADLMGAGMDCRLGHHPAGELQDLGSVLRILDAFDQDWARVRVMIAFAPVSLFCVGLAACAAAALLSLRRRLPDDLLRRARGASAIRLAGAVALRTAPVVLLGCAAGVFAAQRLAPQGGSPPGQLSALSVAAVGWLLLPALSWYLLRDGALHAPVRTRARRARGAALRRITLEGALLLLAAAGVYTLHARGAVAEPDLQMAAVPALLGIAAVVLLVRCYPPPVRAAARWSARGRGTVPLVALTRAAQDAPARALALLVLVTTLATAVFAGLVGQTLVEGRKDTARWRAGADASYTADRLDAQTVRRISVTPGIRHRLTTESRGVDLNDASDGTNHGSVDLVSLDSATLRAAVPGSAVGRALAGLRRTGGDIPVLAGPELRQGGLYTARVRGAYARLKVVGPLPPGADRDHTLGPVRDGSDSPLLLTDGSAVGGLGGPTVRKAALLLYGPDIDRPALRSLVPRSAPGSAIGQLRILADEQDAAERDGVLAALTSAYRLGTAFTLLLALVALVLDLLLSAPERGRTAARLRTMGLGDRATGALHLVQLLPMVLAAAVGGSVLGLFLPELLGPALDLHGFTGGPAAPAVRADYGAAAALGGGFLLLVAAAVAVETVLARRRKLTAVLRLGEQR